MKKAFLLSSLCFFISCSVFIAGYADYSSAKKYFKKGQYDLAAYHLSKSLTLKPNNKKAINLFELSYDIAVSGHKQNIRKLLSINNNSINKYLGKNNNLIRGSFQPINTKLYLEFYSPKE